MKFKFDYPPKNEVKKGLGQNIKKAIFAAASMFVMGSNANASKYEGGNPADSLKFKDIKKIETLINKEQNKVEIKIANYFQTDKADISKENETEINKLLTSYIDNLNKDNINKFTTPTVNVSCDPRNTNSYENGNVGLARARANETQQIVRQIVNSYDFSKSGLNQEEINNIKEKFSNLNFNIPETGVINYHQVKNQSTGSYFTDIEWQELHRPGNENKKLEVYKIMRFVNLELSILKDDEPSIEKTERKITKIEQNKTFETNGYDKVMLLVDKSPSMEIHKKELIKKLLENSSYNIKTSVIGYTNKIDAEFVADNFKMAAENIEKMSFVNEDKELTIDATIKALEINKDTDGKGIAFVITDEELQGVSKEKIERLKQLSKDKNIDIAFTVMVREKTFKLSLYDVEESFNKKFVEIGRAQSIEQQQNILKFLNKLLVNKNQELTSGNNNKNYLKDLRESIDETKLEIKNGEERLKRLHEVNIDDFVKRDYKKSTVNYQDFASK